MRLRRVLGVLNTRIRLTKMFNQRASVLDYAQMAISQTLSNRFRCNCGSADAPTPLTNP